jgi:glyoxylase-like metal-dependent hydrolase (beta-lactamase superfamily II)
MVCHCLILETARGLVLVDTGLGTADLDDPRGRLGVVFPLLTNPALSRDETALAHVERLGFRREDVRHIVPTHLDVDHAGGLSDFPAAQVHVLDAEHEAAMHPASLHERLRYRQTQWAHRPEWVVHSVVGERWFGFDAVRAVPGTDDEVLLVPLIGHTRGHSGVAVRTPGGWLLHAGDAYFFHAELDPTHPRCTPGLAFFQRTVAVDNLARLANQARLRELARDHAGEITIFSAHSPVELDALAAQGQAMAPLVMETYAELKQIL